MLPAILDYAAPTTIQEAVERLAATPDARFVAGSYKLIIDLKMRRLSVGTLVDLRKITDLYAITLTASGLEIGSMASLSAIADNPTVQNLYPALAEAAVQTGDAQIRNMAAIGGVIAYQASTSDLAAALLALNAVIYAQSVSGQRSVDAVDFFTGDGSGTVLHQNEIIIKVELPTSAVNSIYEKYTHPATLDAIIGVAVQITVNSNMTVGTCALAVSGLVTLAQRLTTAEAALVGKPLTDESIENAVSTISGIEWLPDLQISPEYRDMRLKVMVARALKRLAG